MAFTTSLLAGVVRTLGLRTIAAKWVAALVVGLSLLGAGEARALPQCNISFTVAENSGDTTYIFNATDEINCDPGFSGISPGIQTPSLGGPYVPSAGGSYTTQSTIDDDRIDYTPKAGFHGTETFEVCGEPGTTTCGTVTVTVTPATISLSPTSLTAGTVASAFSATVTASGGVSPYSGFTVISGALPPGLSLNSSTGLLHGTPTGGGSYNFTIQAADSSMPTAVTGSRAYSLTINAPAISLSPTSLPSGQQGVAYSQTVTASGGTAAYGYTISAGALPTGLSLSSAGLLSGTPSANGSFSFTIKATDSSTGLGPYNGTRAYSLVLAPPPGISLSPSSLSGATVGTAYNQTLSGSGGASPYTFALTSGALPAGMTLSSAGALTGTPTAGGSFNFTVTATDSISTTGNQAYTLTVAAPTITLTPASLAPGTVATTFSQSVSAGGGTGTYTYGVAAGALPSGLSLNSSTGAVSGTPTAGGTFNFTVTATDSSTGTGPYTGSRAFSLSINAPTITVSPTSLPAGQQGSAYSQSVTASGGISTYSFALTAGALPTGLSLASNGTLSGTPSVHGNFSFTVTATDSATGAGPYTGSRAYSLSLAQPAITLSPTTATAATVGVAYSQPLAASGGASPYTYALTSGALPAGLTLNTSTGAIAGTPTAGGTFNFTVAATDAGSAIGSQAYVLMVNAPTITLNPTSLTAGTVATAFSQTVTASGGTSSYTYALTAGSLPTGLSLNGSTGAITGMPTAGGTFSFTVTATDSSTGTGAYTGSHAYSLTIVGPTITVSPNAPASQTVGQATSLTFNASGGTGSYTFTMTAGALPAGVTLASNGAMSGTATQGGIFNFTITATDNSTGTGPYTGSHAYSLVWQSPTVTISPTVLPNGAAGASYSQTIAGTGGTAPYIIAITSGALPAGLGLNSATGAITGTPTATGSFSVTIAATDSSTGTGPYAGGRAYSFAITAPTVTLGPASLTSGAVGAGYSQTVSGSGGASPYTYALTAGALPTGLGLNGATGVVSGTPTAGGTFNFTLAATDSTGGSGPYTASRAYSVTIATPTITLSPTSLPGGAIGTGYSQSITASGGVSNYGFAVTTGALPAGMTLSSAGVLSGTPTSGGTFNFTVTATDSSTGSGPYTGSRAYGLTIGAPTISLSPTSLTAATAGASYSQTVSAGGGTVPYSFAITAGALPAGVTLNSATGALTGTPNAVGTFNLTISATDSSGGNGPFTGSRAYALTVNAPSLSISPGSVPSPSVALTYSQTLSSSGGAAPYSFSVSAGSLPPGLSLSSAGLLSGAPTAGGSFTFTVRVSDSTTGVGAPFSATRAYSVTVGAPTVSLSPASLAGGMVGAAFNQSVAGSGGAAPYSYAVTAGALPAGLSLNSSTGAITGTPTAGGSFNFTLRTTDSSTGAGAPYGGSQAYSLTIAAATISLSPSSLPAAAVGAAYSQSVTGSGGTSPYSFAITVGALPPGLTLAANGTLSGTPTAGGTFTFSVTTTDSSTGSGPYTGSHAFSLTVGAPTITVGPTSLTAGATGTAYSQTITATGGAASYSFAVTAGRLPTGLTLSNAGLLSGTPTAGGSFNFTVTATDSSTGSGPFTGSRAFSVTINAPTITVSPSSLPAATVATSYSQTLSATGGVGPHSFAITAGALPAGLTLSSTGGLSGTPKAGGSFAFTVTATDSSTGGGPFSGVQAYSFTVSAPTVVLSPATLPAGAYGAIYSQTVAPSGGTAPYTVTLKAGTLPTGMSLSSGGVLSGAPTQFGTFTIALGAIDASTGTGPYSGQLVYSLVINPPTAPTAAAKTATAVYNGSGVAIDLSGLVGGVVTNLSLVTNPGHGTAVVAGETITYTPAASFYGTDTFTYKATGPGGDSGPATVAVTVAAPAPIAVADTAYTPANQAVTLAITANDTGPFTSVAIVAAPAHGAATISGLTVVYTPAANYFGSDSFTYRDVGPGGASGTASVAVTVSALAVPTVLAQTATVVAGSPVTIHTSTGATGAPYSTVAIATAPAQGVAAVNGLDILYTPPANFSGQARFTYTLSNAFGTSQPGTITVTVQPLAVAQSQTITISASQPGSADLTLGASGGPFLSAAIVSLTPANAGTATITGASSNNSRNNSASLGGAAVQAPGTPGHFIVIFSPAKDFIGSALVTYTLSNAYSTSAPSTVIFTVSRPDPSKDARVTGLISAQNEAVRQMAQAQISNFDHRLEDLHRQDGGSKFAVNFNFGDYSHVDYLTDDPDRRRQIAMGETPLAQAVSTAAANLNNPLRTSQGGDNGMGSGGGSGARASGKGQDKDLQLPGGLAIWALGAIDFGQRAGQVGADRLKVSTAGVSFGADAPLGDKLIVGAGVGYGESNAKIGSDGITLNTGRTYVGAVYASLEPLPKIFLDGVVGGGQVHFDSRRLTDATTVVSGSRNGEELFGSLVATYEYRAVGRLHLAPYGRMDIASAELGAFSETGDPVLGLTFARQAVHLLTGDLGVRGEYTFHFRGGDLTPRLLIQYRHDFEDAGSASFAYTSVLSEPSFSTAALPIDHNSLDLGLGAEWRGAGGYRVSFDYEGSAATRQEDEHRLLLKMAMPLN